MSGYLNPPPQIVVHSAAVAYLLTVKRLRILHDFIQNPEYYLRRHLTLQLGALQLQIGVELRNIQKGRDG